MSAPRVLFLVNTLSPGGTERNVVTLCRSIDQSRFKPEVWTLIPGGVHEEAVRAAGVPIRCLNRNRPYDPFFALSAAWKIAHSEFDLIHCFLPAIAFYGSVARVLFRAKQPMLFSHGTVIWYHDWRDSLRGWTVRQFQGFAANSQTARQDLASYGIQPERIHLIPNGHNFRPFEDPIDRRAVRASIGVSDDERLAIFVGRLADSKRVEDLLDALHKIDVKKHRLRLVVVGDGPERTRWEGLASQNGLAQSVQFLGMRSDVPALLRSADLFVFPSETEGLANAIIEASLAGLPIVACSIGGVYEVVRDEIEAFLVQPRDPDQFAAAIERVLSLPDQGKAMGEKARELRT